MVQTVIDSTFLTSYLPFLPLFHTFSDTFITHHGYTAKRECFFALFPTLSLRAVVILQRENALKPVVAGAMNSLEVYVHLSILMEPKTGGPYAKIPRDFGNIFTA